MGKNKKIKSLPYGMGTMYETQSGTIEYKKVLTLKNGQRKRKTVHGKTQKECIEKINMDEKKKIIKLLTVNVNIKMTKKWKIKMYIVQDLLLSL